MLDQGRGLSRDEKGNQAGEARCLAHLRAVSGRVGNVRGAMQVGRSRQVTARFMPLRPKLLQACS